MGKFIYKLIDRLEGWCSSYLLKYHKKYYPNDNLYDDDFWDEDDII